MPSILCPKCGGSGMTVKCNFAVPCHLCKINDTSNQYFSKKDLENKAIIEQLYIVEKNLEFWDWLQAGIDSGKLKQPNDSKK